MTKNSDTSNIPVEGFARLYNAYSFIIDYETGVEENIGWRIKKMDEEELSFVASLTDKQDVLSALFDLTDRDSVMVELAKNVNSPDYVLEILARRNKEFTYYVASNAGASENILTGLLSHPDANIRRTAIDNPSTPLDALQRLLDDPNALVVSSVIKVLKTRDDSPLKGLPTNWVKKTLN